MPKITEVRIIRTRADGIWVIVKILTDQPGLYGIGSASDVNHPQTVIQAIETLAPHLIGRDASHIEDIWQTLAAVLYLCCRLWATRNDRLNRIST